MRGAQPSRRRRAPCSSRARKTGVGRSSRSSRPSTRMRSAGARSSRRASRSTAGRRHSTGMPSPTTADSMASVIDDGPPGPMSRHSLRSDRLTVSSSRRPALAAAAARPGRSRLPAESREIDPAGGPEVNALLFEEEALVAVAPRLVSEAHLAARVDDALPRHVALFGQGRERVADLAGVFRKSSERGDLAVGRHVSRRNLLDDVVEALPAAPGGRRHQFWRCPGLPELPGTGSSPLPRRRASLRRRTSTCGEVARLPEERALPGAVVRIRQQDPAAAASDRRSGRQVPAAPPAPPGRRSRNRPDRRR